MARRLAELSAQLAASREPTRAAPAGELPLDPAVGDEWWADHTRVVPRTPLSVVPPISDEQAPPPVRPGRAAMPVALPVPGRHAARRPLDWAPDLVPESLRGRVRLGGAQLTAVAVLVAVGLALTCWWVVRGDPEPLAPVAVETAAGAGQGAPIAPPDDGAASVPDGAGAPAPPAAPAAPAAAAAPVTVDVAGRVRRPGIVVLDAGARVVDALEEAGGARPGVDLTSLNLARLLVDGEQILVGTTAAVAAPPAPVPPTTGTPDGTTAPTALVDLNLADQVLLETLPQIGPVTAASIIAWRTEHGGFTSVTELLEVDGIGDATLAQLTPYVTV